MSTASKLRDSGIDAVSKAHMVWLSKARALVLAIAEQQGTVSADDLHERMSLPKTAHPNLIGAVFRGLGLRVVGAVKSQRPRAHSRLILVYSTRQQAKKMGRT